VHCRADPKEAERKKLAALLQRAAAARAIVTGGSGPQMWVLNLQVCVASTATARIVCFQSGLNFCPAGRCAKKGNMKSLNDTPKLHLLEI
jgi:hypothetical protein